MGRGGFEPPKAESAGLSLTRFCYDAHMATPWAPVPAHAWKHTHEKHMHDQSLARAVCVDQATPDHAESIGGGSLEKGTQGCGKRHHKPKQQHQR
jgi:hypothetical protein